MNIKKLIKFAVAVCIILTFPCSTMINYADTGGGHMTARQKHVLVLNSYNEGTAWTCEQSAGILEKIEAVNSNITTYVEYLDWKNCPYENNLKYLYDYYKYKYKNKNIDIIIATDDSAFTFALENRKELFTNAPVVFSGVNQESLSRIARGYTNYTGIIETVDPTETIKMALNINPDIENIYIVYDNSESGISTGSMVIKKIRNLNMNLKTIPLNSLPFDQLLKLVHGLDATTSMVFFTTYYSDVEGMVQDFSQASNEISKSSSVPLYHLYDFGLNKGAFGGNMISGRVSGNYAAEQALRILNGTAADAIPVYSPDLTRKVFDYQQIKRFNIPIGSLPNDAQIINEPFSFYKTYKALVWGVLCAFASLIVLLLISFIYIKKIKHMKLQLSVSNEELTQTYEELVATDNELKAQLDEICTIQKSLAESEEKYTYLAFHDVLTGLLNRRSLFEDAKRIFSRKTIRKSAILFIDIDNFKYINDTLGHELGDELIKQASDRLLLHLNDKCTLYRLGGDEFILLEEGIECTDAIKIITDILLTFREEFIIKDIALHIGISIGLAMYPEHGESMEELIKSADIAMYKAKEEGKNRYAVYEKTMDKAFNERMEIEKYLHEAMDNNEFELYYQPQLDLVTEKITGFEALLRWKSPELGTVSPMKFIKIAEDTRLIIPLGEWVLITACDFLSRLHKLGHTELTISVNISTIQLLQSDFNDRVLRIIDHFQLDPRSVELEITETVLIKSFDSINKKLQILSEKGISIALDDFGKGYSSLSYIKQLPISTLKIDKCFIDNVSLETDNKAITRHIITLGRSMGMAIVAEGVEVQEQMDYLKKYQCDKIQGYLFSKPLPEEEIRKLLE
jgi:diguanylate cyclase (GGDEF)-like protein